MKFTDYQLQPFLQQALEKLSFSTPTKIQEKIIPLLLKGESVIGQSQTGSGKSHSFLLPLIHKINPEKQELQLVITVPSRELAEQLVRVTAQLIEEAPTPNVLGEQTSFAKFKNYNKLLLILSLELQDEFSI